MCAAFKGERIGRALVMLGTFMGPLSQWFVFWLLARSGGPRAPGEFATIMAYATPVFVASGWGLRSTCITLREEHPFPAFLKLRILGLGVGLGLIVGIGVLLGLHPILVGAVAVMKIADGVLDLLYAPLQKNEDLLSFGMLMVLNGIVTAFGALVLAMCSSSPGVIVLGSSLGSVVTMVVSIPVVRACTGWGGGKTPERRSGELAHLIAVSSPVAVWQVLAVLGANLPTWIVSLMGTSADVGRFSGAAYILTVGSLLGASLNSMYIGKYRTVVARSGSAELVPIAADAVKRIVLGGVAASVVVFVAGVDALSMVYGSGFEFSRSFLVCLTASAVLTAGAQITNAALLALNMYGDQMLVAICSLVLSLVVILPFWISGTGGGMWAGAVCAAVGSVTKIGLSWWYVRNSRRLFSRRIV